MASRVGLLVRATGPFFSEELLPQLFVHGRWHLSSDIFKTQGGHGLCEKILGYAVSNSGLLRTKNFEANALPSELAGPGWTLLCLATISMVKISIVNY